MAQRTENNPPFGWREWGKVIDDITDLYAGAGGGGGSSSQSVRTMLKGGNNDFIVVASAIASVDLTTTPVHGNPVNWKILATNSDHDSSFYTSITDSGGGNAIRVHHPTVKNVLLGVANIDDSLCAYAVNAGTSVGVDYLELYSYRNVNSGFQLQGNGTNWTASGSQLGSYSLNSASGGYYYLDIPAGAQDLEVQRITMAYLGTNNYSVRRKFSGLPGTLGFGFALYDNATGALVTTAPTSSDYIIFGNFGEAMTPVSLSQWELTSFGGTGGNNFLNAPSTNFWVSGIYELWMKVDNTSSTENSVKWQEKSGVTTYNLYRDTQEDLSTKTLIYSGSLLEFEDTGLTSDTYYYYQLEDQTNTEITRFNARTL